MLTRLFQRAGAIWAASVALFVCLVVPAYANTAPQVNVYGVDTVSNADGHFEARYHFQRRFAANDPVYPGKVDYVTRKIKVEKRGNPLKWVKRNPLEVAAAAAAASAGWVIDELTSQVVNPVQSEQYPDGYSPGYYFSIDPYWSSGYGSTPYAACYDLVGVTNVSFSGGVCTFKLNGTDYNRTPYKISCSGSQLPYCVPPDMVTVTDNQPVNDADVWDVFNPAINDAPAHHLEPWAKDANGNPYIYPEVKAEQAKIAETVPGAEPLPDAVVVNDPLAGQGLGPDGYPTGEPVPTPEAPPAETPPLEFPDDYAREGTLTKQKGFIQELRDYATELSTALKEDYNDRPDIDTDNPADKVYKPLTDQFDTLPDLPAGIPTVRDFGINSGSSCQQITFNWMGASVDFPSASQCSKLNVAKQILGWFIYVCTFFGCVYTILGARALKP